MADSRTGSFSFQEDEYSDTAEEQSDSDSDSDTEQIPGQSRVKQLVSKPTERQIITEGPTQVGTRNTLINNPTTNNNKNSYNNSNNTFQFHYNIHIEKYIHNAPAPLPSGQNFQIEPGQQLPGLSHIAQAALPPDQCVQHLEALKQTGQPCPFCGQGPLVDTSAPDISDSPTEQCPSAPTKSRRPQPSQKTKAKLKSGIQDGSTEMKLQISEGRQHNEDGSSQCEEGEQEVAPETKEHLNGSSTLKDPKRVSVVDSGGQELLPGDVVWLDSGSWGYYSVYIGNMEVIRCNLRTQEVEKIPLDLTQPFRKRKVTSDGRCKLFSPRRRVERAMSCVGRHSPIQKETLLYFGLDFVIWALTGMDWVQAQLKGFKVI